MSTIPVYVPPTVTYNQLLEFLGLSTEMKVIDVYATDSISDSSTSRKFSHKVAHSIGVTAGYGKKLASATVGFLNRPEVRVGAIIGHWVSWTMLNVFLILFATSYFMFFFWLLSYLYVSNTLYHAALAIS